MGRSSRLGSMIDVEKATVVHDLFIPPDVNHLPVVFHDLLHVGPSVSRGGCWEQGRGGGAPRVPIRHPQPRRLLHLEIPEAEKYTI